MSSNHLIYDKCAYAQKMNSVDNIYSYAMYNGKYDNSAKCRLEFGMPCSTQVSLYSGNLVDLESDLRGQTIKASDCAIKLFYIKNLYKIKLHNKYIKKH